MHLTLLTRNPQRFAETQPWLASRVTLIQGDIVDFSYPKGCFDYVIHAAAETDAQSAEAFPGQLFRSIVMGTQRVLDFALKCGCRKLLYVSSGAVYGKQPPDVLKITESQPCDLDLTSVTGLTAYAEGKRAAEWLAVSAAGGSIHVSTARLFAFAGRSYMYAADMALWLVNILFLGENRRAYNVGSEECVTIEDLARRVAALSEPSPKIYIMEGKKDGALPSRYIPSVERMRTELNMSLHFSLDEAILRTLQWLRLRGN